MGTQEHRNYSLELASGSKSVDFSELLIGQAMAATASLSRDINVSKGVYEALSELAPSDSIEGALMAQALAVHLQAMDMLANSAESRSPEVRDTWLRLAVKLMTLYTRQVEVLTKYQKKGSQYMQVEHIHIHDGAQAVVGCVDSRRGR